MYVQSRYVRTCSGYAVIGVGTSATLQYGAGPDATGVGDAVGVGLGVGATVGVAVGAGVGVAVLTAVGVAADGAVVAEGSVDGDGETTAPPQAAIERTMTSAAMRETAGTPCSTEVSQTLNAA